MKQQCLSFGGPSENRVFVDSPLATVDSDTEPIAPPPKKRPKARATKKAARSSVAEEDSPPDRLPPASGRKRYPRTATPKDTAELATGAPSNSEEAKVNPQRLLDSVGQKKMPANEGRAANDFDMEQIILDMESQLGVTKTELEQEGEDTEMKLLAKAAKHGFSAREPVGQRFFRSPEAKSDEYKSLHGHEAKRAFRQQWAEAALKSYTAKKSKREEWQEVDENEGTYLPLAKMVAEEGGDAAAVEAAKKYAQKCEQMKGKFVRFNTWTERKEYLYFKTKSKEIFARSWATFQQWASSDGDADRGGASAGEPTQPPTKALVRSNALPHASSGAESTKTEEPSAGASAKAKTARKGKSAAQKALGDAQEAKLLYSEAMTKVTSIQQGARNDPIWAWANDATLEALQKDMHTALSKMEAELSSFGRAVLTREKNAMKKDYNEEELVDGCKQLAKVVPLMRAVLDEATTKQQQ